MSTAAAPAVTRSSWTGRWPSPRLRAPARRAMTTRWSSCQRSRWAAVPPVLLAVPPAAEAAAAGPAAAADPRVRQMRQPGCLAWRSAPAVSP